MGLRARHAFPCAEIVRGPRQRANPFRRHQARLDRGDDIAGDLVLHGKNIAELAVVALRPMMAAGDRVDQLRADADAFSRAAHAAFQHIAHP
jgi:hypothetical protein